MPTDTISAPDSTASSNTPDTPAAADTTLPTEVAAAVLALLCDTGLAEAWAAVKAANDTADIATFVACITVVTGRDCGECAHCGEPTWTDDGCLDADGALVCQDCEPECYRCEKCEDLYRDDCDMTWIGDGRYCRSCRDQHFSYCENCSEWYHDDESAEHEHERDDDCWCEAPLQTFAFPANGQGSIAQDKRLQVELPAGVIDPRGIEEIIEAVWRALHSDTSCPLTYPDLSRAVEQLDPTWHGDRGKFTRRLSTTLYQQHNVKLPPGLLSIVGNLARQHSSSTKAWQVEFTRDLNQESEAFYNEDSCWWGDYSSSRCALKNWGGLGMVSYPDAWAHYPSGRAWVQPLNEQLEPTHDAFDAHSYLVYNGYGNLEGHTAARIVAHLTSRTYRRVQCDLPPQYVNGDTGYLISDQVTCDKVDAVVISANTHAQFDAGKVRQRIANVNIDQQQAA